MAGVKQFDRIDVLDRAMALFWRRGYEATSIQDLVDATGINRGSLYASFTSKKGLFLAVLDHYAEKLGKPLTDALDDPDPRRAIEGMFEAIIRRTSDPKWPRGCLNTNTTLECPSSGDEISRKIAERLGQQETAIYRVLRRAQAENALDPAQDARALARFFMGMMKVAMSVWVRPSPPSRTRNRIARTASNQGTARMRG